ncbi:hypothetical protein [Saccharothrix xinjiangensis]|uniref:Uncharacterized protein n=1 Tax=Saccharothrix xinjiangensis TaxID=204798 RepID=A0ABV9XTI6_9PSEU
MVGGLLLTAALAITPAAVGASWWIHALVVAVPAGLITWQGRDILLQGRAFEELGSNRVRERMASWFTVALALHLIWIAATATGLLSWWQAGPCLAALGALEWAVAANWEYRVTRIKPAAQVEVFEAELVDDEPPTYYDGLDDSALGTAVLAALGFDHYVVLPPNRAEELRPGVTVWVCQKLTPLAYAEQLYKTAVRQAIARRQAPERVKIPEIKELPTLTHKDAEEIANVIMSLTGVEMAGDYVEVVRHRLAGRVIITVATTDIGAQALPYTALDATPRDPRRMAIGLAKRGTDVAVNPRQHWKLIGPTGSGKSGAENVWIAEDIVRGHRVIVCGADKVWDLVEEWVDGLGGVDLPIRAVQGLGDTLRALVAVARHARWKQTLPAAQRAGIAPVRLVVTESSRVMVDRSLTIGWDGRDWTAGELIGHISRSTQGADDWLLLSSQDFDHDYWGTEAASIKNNTGGTLLCRSRNADERRRALGDAYYGLPDLQHPGESYVKDSGIPEYVKLFYPQESDPSKPRLHDGPTVRDIARIRAGQAREFTGEELRVMGTWFATLPRRMTPAYRDYLRGERPLTIQIEDDDFTAPQRGADALIAEADAMLAQLGIPLPAALPAPEPQVAEALQRPPLRERIVQLVEQAGQLGRKDVLAALLAEGYDTTQQSVDNALSALAKPRGRLRRDQAAAGVYLPAHTSLTSPTPTPVTAGGGASHA